MSRALRLFSFNILEGLQPVPRSETERRLLDRQRVEAAKAVVGDLNPDILVLNEALFCQEHVGKKIDYALLFDFPHCFAALYDGSWGNAILSRFPIVSSREMRIYNRGGIIVEIESPSGRFTVASYHPHPHRHPANKALDFSELVRGVDGPLIVCGDLNSISPEDDIDQDQLVEAFKAFSKDAETVVERFVESGRLVFDALAKFGLKDAIPVDRSDAQRSPPT